MRGSPCLCVPVHLQVYNPLTGVIVRELGNENNFDASAGHLAAVAAFTVLTGLGESIVSGGQDGRVIQWSGVNVLRDLSAAAIEGTSASGGVQAIISIPADFTTGNPRVAASYADSTIRIWDIASSSITARLVGHEGLPRSMLVLPDGALMTGDVRGTLKLWSTFREGRELGSLSVRVQLPQCA